MSTSLTMMMAAALTLTMAATAHAQDDSLSDSKASAEEAPRKTISTNELVDAMEKVVGDDSALPVEKPLPLPVSTIPSKSAKKNLDLGIKHPAAPAEFSVPPAPAPVKDDSEVLSDREQHLTVDNELADADTSGYQDAASENVAESAKLSGEIKDLERQLKSTMASSVRAKKLAALTEKRLDLQKSQQREATARASRASADRRNAEKRVAQLKSRVETNSNKLSATRQKTADAQAAIAKLNREGIDLERQLKITIANIEKEKAKEKVLNEKRAKLALKNKQTSKKISEKLGQQKRAKPKSTVATNSN